MIRAYRSLCLFLMLAAGLAPLHAFELKSAIRNVFSQAVSKMPLPDFGKLPEGLEIIDGEGYRGIKIMQGKLEARVHTWYDNTGLLENYQRREREAIENGEFDVLVAAINGTFYSPRGVLGQVIGESRIPGGILQIPGKLSRCFFATFRGAKKRQFWYLGETSLNASELLDRNNRSRIWFNTATIFDSTIDNFIGGGGWILRDRKDVHMEAYERQRFRFRREDQISRKTVIAQDDRRNLFFLVFEDGHNFHMVARTFIKEKVFENVREAIFLDGGSSSAIVLKGKYLVPPLYVIDKARFTSIQVVVPPTTW